MQFLELQVWPADRVLFGNDLGCTRNNVLSMDVDQGNGGFDYVFCIRPKLMPEQDINQHPILSQKKR